jgi:ATP-dependent helicase/nuclease subunit A
VTAAHLFDVEPDDDAPVRDRIATVLGENQFVEASAGTGKTRSLVDRVHALVTAPGDDQVPLSAIAAITFTEKAAAELRERIRHRLEQGAAGDGDGAERCRAALDELDGAAIGTLHAFAQRVLTEHPFAAGLPPDVDVLDEIESTLDFDERWRSFVDRLLDDDTLAPALLTAFAGGVELADLREIAVQLGANWDLVASRVLPIAAPAVPALSGAELAGPAIEELTRLAAGCSDDGDRLLGALRDARAWLADRLGASNDPYETVRLLSELAAKPWRLSHGRQASWAGPKSAVVERAKAVADRLVAHRDAAVEAAVRVLVERIARFTLDAAAARRAEGRLEFHDLLVLARDVVRDERRGASVRAGLARRYRVLLLDEFQDTDPIQADLAVRIAAADPADPHTAAAHWTDVPLAPGRLFVVGDPKQSIYRFRRADIATFLTARGAFAAARLALTRSFRSAPAVVDFVNHVFAQLIVPEEGSQPEYQALAADRDDHPRGPGVALTGCEPLPPRTPAGEQREAEAGAVARAILDAVGSWEVSERAGDTLVHRPARLGDIAILLPARTSLPQLQDALDDHGIPYRAETSSLVWATQQVRDLMAALRAVADPSDELSLVTALRSPLYGCGDDDLFRYRVTHGGAWRITADRPPELPSGDPVVAALDHLRALHEARWWASPSELLERLVADRRVLELGFAQRRPRDLWRRIRFVVDQARAFADARGEHGLRAFVDWAALQADEGSRVVETVLPETDDDSVRILTIHGAKGLEFPIAILSGMTTLVQHRRGGTHVSFPPGEPGYALRVRSALATTEYERFVPIDEQLDTHEKLRLLYVGATRARDHLVVSLHRTERAPSPDRATHAEVLWSAIAGTRERWVALDPAPAAVAPVDLEPPPPLPPRDEWQATRDAALASAGMHRILSATGIARTAAEAAPPAGPTPDPGLAKDPVDLEAPPWNRGRYGTAIGRAVHGVLQTVDLATGSDLEAAARAQAAAEAVDDQLDVVVALARSALASDIVQEAVATGRARRETYVATVIGHRTLEGYVDLVYDTPAGLVVVDYKTDPWRDPADLDAKLERYRLQGASYALAVARATGQPVARCVFLFLAEAGAVARDVLDLEAAVREVEAIVAARRAGEAVNGPQVRRVAIQ